MNKKKSNKAQEINKEKILENTLQKLDQIENTNFETAQILSHYSFFDLAKKIINENLKKPYDEIEFISCISTYLFKSNIYLIEQNQLETHKSIISETKFFLRHIKKSLKKIAQNFNATYLLYEKDNKFTALQNTKLIEHLEELSQILNLTNNHHQAELAFDLKSKIELGFQRYFLHENETILLCEFNQTGEYKIANNTELIQIQEHFNLNIKPKINLKINNFTEILTQLNYLKQNKTEFNKNLKKYIKILEFFPQQIYQKEEYNQHKKISKSLNKNFEENTMQLIKEKLILINPYNINSYNLTLKLLK